MRLLRVSFDGAARPALMDQAGLLRDLSDVVPDLAGAALHPSELDRLAGLAQESLRPLPHGSRLLPPIAGIGKIIGVGLNYRDHAEETGLPLPKEPTLFLKATSALAGPDDALRIPRGATKVDWEVELGVVIGAAGAYIEERHALDHVAGYVLGIDFSERAFQFERGGQGFKGKSADSFAPLGPYLVTKDVMPDPQDVVLRLSANGIERQHGSTRDMIFSVAALIAYTSAFMSLQPGDVILTGTPAGVGMGQKPQTWLQPGDTVVAQAAVLGQQTHRVLAPD